MDELVRWLRRQLDKDAAMARELAGRGGDDLPVGLRSAGEQVRDAYGDPEPPEDGVSPADRLWWLARDAADWIEAWSPARVLREIDAKRQILSLHGGDLRQQPMFCGHCEHDTPCPTLRLLALPYADRPGYRAEWAPTD